MSDKEDFLTTLKHPNRLKILELIDSFIEHAEIGEGTKHIATDINENDYIHRVIIETTTAAAMLTVVTIFYNLFPDDEYNRYYLSAATPDGMFEAHFKVLEGTT